MLGDAHERRHNRNDNFFQVGLKNRAWQPALPDGVCTPGNQAVTAGQCCPSSLPPAPLYQAVSSFANNHLSFRSTPWWQYEPAQHWDREMRRRPTCSSGRVISGSVAAARAVLVVGVTLVIQTGDRGRVKNASSRRIMVDSTFLSVKCVSPSLWLEKPRRGSTVSAMFPPPYPIDTRIWCHHRRQRAQNPLRDPARVPSAITLRAALMVEASRLPIHHRWQFSCN